MSSPLIFVSGMDVTEAVGGGHRPYVRTFAHAATALGFDVHIFVVSRRPRVEVTDYGTVHCIAPAPVPLRGSLYAFHARPLARAIAAFARSQRGPLLLHGFGRWGYAGVLAQRNLSARGIAVTRVQSTYTVSLEEARSKLRGARAYAPGHERRRFWREYWETRLVFGSLEKPLHTGALVLVNYRSVERLIVNYFGNEIACRVIPYTVEPELKPEHPPVGENGRNICSSPAVPSILALSRQDPRKGTDVLLRALAALRLRNLPFHATLVGGGALLETNRALMTKLGLADCVAMPGYVDGTEALRRSHDIFVLPSLSEQSGSVALLEAMRAGMACVASACDGIPEDIVDDDTGLLVEPGNPDALANALARLMADPILRGRLARRGQSFRHRFGGPAFAACLERIYAELGFRP